MNTFSLTGRTIVVTGAAGQLGSSFTTALLDAGANVAALDLVPVDREHDRLCPVVADVTDRASLEKALATITAAFGTPTGLVNCAALDSPPDAGDDASGAFETYPDEVFERVMDVNVHGVVRCCQVFGGAMAAGDGGSIVNIASTYGMVSPDQRIYRHLRDDDGHGFYKPASYTASKASLIGLSKYLGVYWADKGVRVNTLTLGGVFNGQDDAFLAGYTARVPLGRMAHADEYDGAVVFLLSDAASYMTGSNLVIDGGWTAW